MIYYLDELVNWKDPKSRIEKDVRDAIETIREKYFGENRPNVVKFLNNRAKTVQNTSGYYEPMKKFPLRFVNRAGDWRYTKSMPKSTKDGPSFIAPFELMSYIKYMYEVDIEYIYFLIIHCESVLSGRITLIDDEAIATAKAVTMATDLELRYHLFSESSPIAKDRALLSDIAVTFGVTDVDALGINQLKNRIYELVTAGDNSSHRFINTQSFMELIGNEEKRKVAKVIYGAVKRGDIVYSNKDYGFHFVEGGKVNTEIIFSVAGRDASSATQIFISECASNDKIRQDVYGYLGVVGGLTVEEIRNKNIHMLRATCKEKQVPISNIMSKSKEELVEALCAFEKVLYERPLVN